MRVLRLFLAGLLCLVALPAAAQVETSGHAAAGEALPARWKSADGQEYFALRVTAGTLQFERVTPDADRMFGEFFTGTVDNAGPPFAGTASAAVLQITNGIPTSTCTIQMSITLSAVTPARIEGRARPARIDPACMPNNFSVTMTALEFAWLPATESDMPPPQIQRRIEASVQYRRRMDAAAYESQLAAQASNAVVAHRHLPNRRLRRCDVALRNLYLFCPAPYPYAYSGRNYVPAAGSCAAAQIAVDTSCY